MNLLDAINKVYLVSIKHKLILKYDNWIIMNTETTGIEMSQTTIKIQMSTRDRLVDLGKKNESYDTIINKLIDFFEQNKK